MEFSTIKGFFGGFSSIVFGYIGLIDALNLMSILLVILGGLGSLFLTVTSILEKIYGISTYEMLKRRKSNKKK